MWKNILKKEKVGPITKVEETNQNDVGKMKNDIETEIDVVCKKKNVERTKQQNVINL